MRRLQWREELPLRYEVNQLASGWAGTDQTVAKINQLVDDSLTDPVVVTTAQGIVRGVRERDTFGEMSAISNYVRSRVRYTGETVETVKTPRYMIDEIKRHGRATGDCDDHVSLAAALNRAVGHRVRFQVVSQRQDKQAGHIFMEVFVPGRGWVTDELIVKNKPVGWRIPRRQTTAEKSYSVNGLAGLSCCGDVMRCGVGCPSEETETEQEEASMHDMIATRFIEADWIGGGQRVHRRNTDMAPRKRYHRGRTSGPSRYHIKRGGMMELREDGTVGAIEFGDLGEIGKKKSWLKKLKGSKILKVVGIAAGVVGGGVIVGGIISAAAKAAKAKEKAKKAKEAAKAAGASEEEAAATEQAVLEQEKSIDSRVSPQPVQAGVAGGIPTVPLLIGGAALLLILVLKK